jgi:hypothetical protein
MNDKIYWVKYIKNQLNQPVSEIPSQNYQEDPDDSPVANSV